MSGDDPHVHVDVKLGGEAATRNIVASTFGMVADLPATVTTGCGSTVPRAMTSTSPAAVTCLPCREFARRRHLQMADQLVTIGTLPGSPLNSTQTAAAVAHHHELARRFEA